MGEIKAPGLKYRTRSGGKRVPVWCARADAIAAGYPIKTCNLSETPEAILADRCQRLWSDMLAFLGRSKAPSEYNGSIGSLVDLYTDHPKSPFHKHKLSTRRPYESYLRRVKADYGSWIVRETNGFDLMRIYDEIRGDNNQVAAASMALTVIKSALNFAMVFTSGEAKRDCRDLRETLSLLDLPRPQPRTHAPDAAAIERARRAAHELGHHRAALCYALQFETSARQWDMTGQWVALSDERPSAIIHGKMKWVGPTWASIDAKMILTYTPTKTERTTGARVSIDLGLCPMVMEELALIPPADRVGPLIVNEAAGLPYRNTQFPELWRDVRKRAGLPETLWNRDIRAGAITEGGKAGATADDRAKVAGHSKRMTETVYDRDVLVSANRVAEARAAYRVKRGA
jgi:hypothetical protein